MRKIKIITTIILALVLLPVNIALAEGQENPSTYWKLNIYDYNLYEQLETTEEVVAYDGSRSDIIHKNVPGEGKQYIILDISVSNNGDSKNEFALDDIKLNIDGIYYKRLDNSFIRNHGFKTLPLTTINLGEYRGHVLYEIPDNASVEDALLEHEGIKIRINELSLDENRLGFIGDTNIAEYHNRVDRQKLIDSKLSEMFERGNYSLESPLIIQDPYGEAPLSALIMFETELESEISLLVKGKDKYTDVENIFEGLRKVHQIPVVGLYADYDNQVTISAKDNKGKIESKTFTIKTEKLPDSSPVFTLNHREPEKMEEGMTFLTLRSGFAIVDSNGEVRWYYTNATTDSPFHRIENGNMLLASNVHEAPNRGRLLEIDLLGKVHNSYYVGAAIHHDSEENTNGNFLVSQGSGYKEINRQTGEIVHTFNIATILPEEMKTYYTDNVPANNSRTDWIHYNTNCPDGDYVYLSPRNQDIVIKMKQYTNEIQWILGEPENIPKELEKYWLNPIGNIKFQTGQHSPERIVDLDDDPNTIDLMVFDNNYFHVRGNKELSEQYSGASHFRVDEKNMTVEQIWHFGAELGSEYHTEWHGDADYLPNANTALLTISAGASRQPRKNTSIIEVTKDDERHIVFDLDISSVSGKAYTYRSERLPLYPDIWNIDVFNNVSQIFNEPSKYKALEDLTIDLENLEKSNATVYDIGISNKKFIHVFGLDSTKNNHIVLKSDTNTLYAKSANPSGNYFELNADISALPIGKYIVGILSENKNENKHFYSETDYYFEIKEDIEITLDNQDYVDQQLRKNFLSGEYTPQNPYIEVDPYNVSPLTAIAFFNTEKPSRVNITVKGKNNSVDINHSFSELTNSHTIPIYGLYAGEINEVVFEILFEDGTSEIETHHIPTNKITDDLYHVDMELINAEQTDSKLLFLEGSRNFAVDKYGDIRWYFNNELLEGNTTSPIRLLENGNISMLSGYLEEQPYYTNHVYEMNYLGRIYNRYEVTHAHHEILELPNGNLLVAGNNPNRNTIEDYIIEIDRKTGKIVKTIDLYNILGIEKIADDTYVVNELLRQHYSPNSTLEEVFKAAVDTGKKDWFHLNAVSYHDGFIFVSGRQQDKVLKINYNTEEIVWILTDPSDELPENLASKLLTPVGDNFEYSYGQHAVVYKDNILALYDNGNNRSKNPYNMIKDEDNYSRGVSYKINEEDMTVEQIWEFGRDTIYQTFTPYIGDIDVLGENHYLINFGGLITENGAQTSNIFAAFFGTADTHSRVVEVRDDKVIMNATIEGEGYSNVYRASKESIYQNQKELILE